MATQETIPGMEGLVKKTSADLLADVIQQAIFDPSFDPQKLRVLMEMQIQWEDREKKKKFDAALEIFRSNKTVVEKTKQVLIATKDGGQMEYWHAELDKAADIVTEALLAVGLTYTWKPDFGPEGKPVQALILRGFGHQENMGQMQGPPDLSGGKNAMQAVGSSATYLARYVLLYSLGIVAHRDDDGRSATGGLSEQAIEEFCVKIKDSSTSEEGLAAFQEGWKAADNLNDKPARDRIRKVWEEKKKEIWRAKSANR
jgi:hypothetical protein